MRKTAVGLLSTILMAGPAFAAPNEVDVMRKVRELTDFFSKGDLTAAVSLCAAQSSVIDDFPPYSWQGTTGCADWARDFDAHTKKLGMTVAKVTLGRARIDVSDDRAYVVVPATLAFKQNGKQLAKQNQILAVTLNSDGNSWRITGWAWATKS
jgi:hypothetical protein